MRRVFVPEKYLHNSERVSALYVDKLGVGKVYSYEQFRSHLKEGVKVKKSVVTDLQFKEL